MKALRYMKHNFRQRVEHNLVLERLGELMIRNIHTATRALLYGAATGPVDAVVLEGFTPTVGAGLSVNLSGPKVAVQDAGNADDVFVCVDTTATHNVVLDPADPTNPRIDNIVARYKLPVDKFLDTAASQADPSTQTITPAAFYRDKELQLEFLKVTGTPAGVPAAPAIPGGTAGSITGTVAIPTTINLQTEYILNIGVGDEGEFVEVDCRGATPAATTLAEIIAAINLALGAVIASASGNFLKLDAPGTGFNSAIKLKQPLNPAIDAANNILGIVESIQYIYYYRGGTKYFKVCEVFVPALAVTLIAGNLRSVYNKDSQWNAGAATILLGKTLERVVRDRNFSGGYPGLTLFDIDIFDQATGLIKSALRSIATAIRTWTMPDETGTVALLSHLDDRENRVINGSFDFWQRGLSHITPAYGTFTADRWRLDGDGTGATFTLDRLAFSPGQTDVPDNPSNFLRWINTVAGTGESYKELFNPIEYVSSLSGQKISVTCYIRGGASYSVPIRMRQHFGTGGSPSTSVITAVGTANVTSSWQRFDFTFSLPSIFGMTLGTDGNDRLELIFDLPLNTTFQFDLSSVILVPNLPALRFSRAGGSKGGELALCQRYFEKCQELDQTPDTTAGPGTVVIQVAQSAQVHNNFRFNVHKRAIPTITIYQISNNISFAQVGSGGLYINSSSPTPGDLCIGNWTADAEIM